MSDQSIWLAFGTLVFVALIAGAWYALRVWNSPDGERYMRRGTQGPFVPLDKEEIEAEKRNGNKRKW